MNQLLMEFFIPTESQRFGESWINSMGESKVDPKTPPNATFSPQEINKALLRDY